MVENTSQPGTFSTAGEEELNKAREPKKTNTFNVFRQMLAASREDFILRMVSWLEIGSIIRVCFLCKRKVGMH